MDKKQAGLIVAVVAVVLIGICATHPWTGNGKDNIEPDTQWYDSAESYFEIGNANQLAGLACLVNHGTSFEDKIIALTSDITLRGQWTPIGMGKYDGATRSVNGAAFDGTFQGNGHIVAGLRISTSSAGDSAGLFGVIDGGTVKDVALIDAKIDSPSSDCVGGIAGMLCGGGTISGCTVGEMNDGSAISSDTYTGGIAGRIAGTAAVSGCTNFAAIANPDGPGCGGIVGKSSYPEVFSDLVIQGCSNVGAVSGHVCVGGILGTGTVELTDCVNIGDVSSTSGGSTGGIVGKIVNDALLQCCDNHGNISSVGSEPGAFGVGGIVGLIRYDGDLQEYPEGPAAFVSICTNLGDVATSGPDAGGIVGTLFNSAHVCGDNLAGKVSAAEHAAGIVGSYQTTEVPIPPRISENSLVLFDNVSTTADITASETDLFICSNGNTVKGTPSSQELRPGFIIPSVIVAETPEDIPKSVSCEGYTATLVIPTRTSIEGMTFDFPGSSISVCSASCPAGVLKVSSSEGKPVPQAYYVKFNISFGILEDADARVTVDVDVPDGVVPEVSVFNGSIWQDTEVLGYTSGSVTFRMGFGSEVAVLLYAPDDGEQA